MSGERFAVNSPCLLLRVRGNWEYQLLCVVHCSTEDICKVGGGMGQCLQNAFRGFGNGKMRFYRVAKRFWVELSVIFLGEFPQVWCRRRTGSFGVDSGQHGFDNSKMF